VHDGEHTIFWVMALPLIQNPFSILVGSTFPTFNVLQLAEGGAFGAPTYQATTNVY